MINDIRLGMDIHKVTASEFWGIPEDQVTPEQRAAAKFVVFGLMYGRGAKSVAKQVGITEMEAKQIIANFFAKYPVAARWLTQTHRFARDRKFVMNHFGRLRRLPYIDSNIKKEAADARRQALNAPIQSSAADITGIAMIRIKRALEENNLRARPILTVHDSIVFECPNEELPILIKLVYKRMTDPIPGIIVPLDVEVEVGPNWAEVKEWKELKES